MKRHLCIWLPNWPTPNGPANSEQPKKVSDTFLLVAACVQQQICPLVALETFDNQPSHRCDSLLCEISGVAHLFGGEAGLLTAVDQLLMSMGINGQLAIADTVGAAWAMAHYSHFLADDASCQAVRRPAPSAEQTKKRLPGRSAQIIPPGATAQAIERLPVESLRIGPQTAATLSRLGVHLVDQLLRLPRGGLALRLGKPLVRRIEQVLGEIDEPMALYRPPAEHVACHRLEYSSSDQNILADRIGRLIEEVRAGLASCQRGALRMTCRLDLSAHPPLTLEVGLFAPTIDFDHLHGLMVSQLETIRLPSAVELLTLAVPLTGPLRSIQTSLFENSANEPNHGISHLVDSLSSRLGCDSVVGVRIKDNPLPEQAFRISALAGNGKSPVRCGKRWQSSSDFVPSSNSPAPKFPSSRDAMRRPVSLLSSPIPIAVATEDGSFHLSVCSPAVPRCVRIAGKIDCIVRCWGPERIETAWWNGPSIRRDYYRIETDSARWLWIFRNLASKTNGYRWMLHGRFD